MGLMNISKQKYRQLSHWCLNTVTEIYMAIKKLKRHKSPYADRIPAELIKAGGRKFRFEIHNLIHSMLYAFFWVIPRRLNFIC
jgi:hypothetical protein